MPQRDLTPAEKEARNEAARLIRHHLWQGTRPASPDKRPWDMSRELNIWKRLVLHGYDPEHINGAISVVRIVRPYDGPMRMTWFYHRHHAEGWCGAPLLHECIGYWHKRQESEQSKTRLPPTVQQVLRGLVDA